MFTSIVPKGANFNNNAHVAAVQPLWRHKMSSFCMISLTTFWIVAKCWVHGFTWGPYSLV